MLYRAKDVAVYIDSSEGVHEANFLKEIGCRVTAIAKGRDLSALDPDIPVIAERKIQILGDSQVEGVQAGERTIACSGLFILRQGVAPDALISNLELIDGHIAVNRQMQTNVPGIFAAGDCIGKPYQVSKACGEGQVAAFSAVDYLDIQKKEKE
jgi:thioredoxin reductase (NADPH)